VGKARTECGCAEDGIDFVAEMSQQCVGRLDGDDKWSLMATFDVEIITL
jgi:hypothetical protein